jgi:hypothetical protein
VCGTDSTVNFGLVGLQIGRAVLVLLVCVCGTDSTLNCVLVGVQIGRSVLVVLV